MPDEQHKSLDEVYEKLAAATSPDEVKSALEECGYDLKMGGGAPKDDSPFPKKDDDGGGKAPPFGKKKDEGGGNPFAKGSLSEMTDSVVAKNFKKRKGDESDAG